MTINDLSHTLPVDEINLQVNICFKWRCVSEDFRINIAVNSIHKTIHIPSMGSKHVKYFSILWDELHWVQYNAEYSGAGNPKKYSGKGI